MHYRRHLRAEQQQGEKLTDGTAAVAKLAPTFTAAVRLS
jgi:hypothetical protein